MPKNYYKSKFNFLNEKEIRFNLEKDGFEINTVGHALLQAKKERTFITFFKDGQVVVKGKNAQQLAETYLSFLEPQLTVKDKNQIYNYHEWICVSSSGINDFFGPVVVSAILSDRKMRHKISTGGALIVSDREGGDLPFVLRQDFKHSVVTIPPEKYNSLFEEHGDPHVILGLAHAQAINQLLEKVDCFLLIDNLRDNHIVQTELKNIKNIKYIQPMDNNMHLGIEAATILSRDKYNKYLCNLSERYDINFSSGNSAQLANIGNQFVEEYGTNKLRHVAKLNFKIALQISKNHSLSY